MIHNLDMTKRSDLQIFERCIGEQWDVDPEIMKSAVDDLRKALETVRTRTDWTADRRMRLFDRMTRILLKIVDQQQQAEMHRQKMESGINEYDRKIEVVYTDRDD